MLHVLGTFRLTRTAAGSAAMQLTLAGGGGHQPCRWLQVVASPAVAGMDEPVDIKVKGLSPGQPVTMATRLQEEEDIFVSHGHYTADENGAVDVMRHHSKGGTYTGCEPMGLFWSLRPQEGTRSGVRLRKKDVTQPHHMTLSVLSDHIAVTKGHQLDSREVLAQVDLQRHYMWKDVVRIPVRHGPLRGTLFVPNGGSGRHQGIIDIYGSTGGLAEYRAAILASRGFTTLALAYVGYEDLPKSLQVTHEYFLEAIDFFSGHANVRPGGIGVIGISMGAMLAMTMSVLSKKIRAVVSIGGSDFLYMCVARYQGKELPYAYSDMGDFEIKEDGIAMASAMYNAKGKEEAAIEIEKATQADFLFLHGTDDENVDARLILNAPKRLLDHGHRNFSLHMYEGAGHLIEPPYIPFCYATWHNTFGAVAICGGETKPHAKAQEDAWAKILTFFRNRLPAAKL